MSQDRDPALDRWSLFDTFVPGLKSRDIVAGGWLAQSITLNPDSPASRSNGTQGMNDRANDYQLSQFAMFAERAVRTDGDAFALGGRVDLNYGADARWMQSRGFDDEWISGRFVSLAMPQLYADVFVPWGNGVKITVGRIWSPIGYEGVAAPDRFFYSATNTYMFAEPSCQTGVLAKYPLDEHWTIQLGVNQGWDVWRDNNTAKSFLGILSWQGNDGRTTITSVNHFGSEEDGGRDRLYLQSFILKHQFRDKWTYVFWNDFGVARGTTFDGDGNKQSPLWNAFHQQLFYAATERTAIGWRFEWFHDAGGTKIVEWLNETPLGKGDTYMTTMGLNWTPRPNSLFRPEIRYDWARGVRPFDDLTRNRQWTFACDAIIRF